MTRRTPARSPEDTLDQHSLRRAALRGPPLPTAAAAPGGMQ